MAIDKEVNIGDKIGEDRTVNEQEMDKSIKINDEVTLKSSEESNTKLLSNENLNSLNKLNDNNSSEQTFFKLDEKRSSGENVDKKELALKQESSILKEDNQSSEELENNEKTTIVSESLNNSTNIPEDENILNQAESNKLEKRAIGIDKENHKSEQKLENTSQNENDVIGVSPNIQQSDKTRLETNESDDLQDKNKIKEEPNLISTNVEPKILKEEISRDGPISELNENEIRRRVRRDALQHQVNAGIITEEEQASILIDNKRKLEDSNGESGSKPPLSLDVRLKLIDSYWNILNDEFDLAVQLAGTIKTSQDKCVALAYALYMQATRGNNETPMPTPLDFCGVEKWREWYRLKGMTKTEAKEKYILLLGHLNIIRNDNKKRVKVESN